MKNIEFIPGTVKDEAKYARMVEIGARLGYPVPQSHLGIQVVDGDGATLQSTYERSRTWNRNFWNVVFSMVGGTVMTNSVFGAGTISLKQTGGALSAVNHNSHSMTSLSTPYFNINLTQANTIQGIQCGTSTAAESFDGFALGSAIAEGSGAGQLNYGGVQGVSASYNAGTKTWTATIARTHANNSSGSITVNETALIASHTSPAFMVARDVLSSPAVVPQGGSIVLTYVISLTFPA